MFLSVNWIGVIWAIAAITIFVLTAGAPYIKGG